MKVKDLILALSSYDPELDVVMSAGSDGVDTANDIDVPALTHIIRDQNIEYWMGRHDFVSPWSKEEGEQVVVIVKRVFVPQK